VKPNYLRIYFVLRCADLVGEALLVMVLHLNILGVIDELEGLSVSHKR
jgi:hypothetical protein